MFENSESIWGAKPPRRKLVEEKEENVNNREENKVPENKEKQFAPIA